MRNSNNNTKKSIKVSEQHKAILHEKTTQTDDESAQVGQDLADLEALSQKTGKEAKIGMLIKRQSILAKHNIKLSEENSQLKAKLKNKSSRLNGMMGEFTEMRTNIANGFAFIQAELKAAAVGMKQQEKEVHKKMEELAEYYEKKQKIFMDKLEKKEIQIGKYKDQIKELSKIKDKAFAALEIGQRNLQAARSDSFISAAKEKEATKNLNDRLYLAENERCKNCKLFEEKRGLITDQISSEMITLKMDVDKKDGEIIEKDKIIGILTGKMNKLEKEKKDAEEEKKKAEYSADSYRQQFQKSEANLNLLKKKYSHITSTGETPPTEEENSLVNILTPPDDNERTNSNNGKGQPTNSSNPNNAQIPTKSQNVAAKKRPRAITLNAEGGINQKNGNQQNNKNYLGIGNANKMSGMNSNKNQAAGRETPMMSSSTQITNQSERPNTNGGNNNNEEQLEEGELSSASPSIASVHSNSSPKPKKQKPNIPRIGANRPPLPGALSSQQSLRMSSSSGASNSKQTGTAKIQQSPDPWRISPYPNIVQNHPQQNARPTSSMSYQIPASQMSSNANIYRRCSGATLNDFYNDVDVEEFESDVLRKEREAFISGVLFARESSSQIGSISATNLDNIQGQHGIGGSSWRGSHSRVIAGPHSNTLDGSQMIERVTRNQPLNREEYVIRSALPPMYERQQPFQQISVRQNIPRPPIRQSVPIPSTSQFPRVPGNLPWHVQNSNPNIGRFF